MHKFKFLKETNQDPSPHLGTNLTDTEVDGLQHFKTGPRGRKGKKTRV